jgi:hypothetical protein
MGLKVIVSKRIDAYRSGPFLGWRKIKRPGYVRREFSSRRLESLIAKGRRFRRLHHDEAHACRLVALVAGVREPHICSLKAPGVLVCKRLAEIRDRRLSPLADKLSLSNEASHWV